MARPTNGTVSAAATRLLALEHGQRELKEELVGVNSRLDVMTEQLAAQGQTLSAIKTLLEETLEVRPSVEASRAAHVGRIDVEKRVDRLARSIAEIEVAIHRAEGNIEADARERIHALRNEARRQLAVLRGHQREASRLLWQLSTTAEGSWDDLKRATERKLTQPRAVVDSMLERFGRAVPRAPRASARPESLFAITPSGG
jgi:chromosome segregation ATPase